MLQCAGLMKPAGRLVARLVIWLTWRHWPCIAIGDRGGRWIYPDFPRAVRRFA